MAKVIANFIGKKTLGGVVIEGGAELDSESQIVKNFSSYFTEKTNGKVKEKTEVVSPKTEEKTEDVVETVKGEEKTEVVSPKTAKVQKKVVTPKRKSTPKTK